MCISSMRYEMAPKKIAAALIEYRLNVGIISYRIFYSLPDSFMKLKLTYPDITKTHQIPMIL